MEEEDGQVEEDDYDEGHEEDDGQGGEDPQQVLQNTQVVLLTQPGPLLQGSEQAHLWTETDGSVGQNQILVQRENECFPSTELFYDSD